MKKLIYLALAMLASTSAFATVYTVNNQSGSDADYTNVPSALSASTAGDTIYVQPSPTNYGDVVITKRVVLMGAGHNPTNSQYNSSFGTISMATNSGGTILKGLNILVLTSSQNVICNNVVVSGCFISYSQGSPLSFNSSTLNNWTFEGNIIQSFNNQPISMLYLGSNLVVRNNFIFSFGAGYNVIDAPSGAHFDHNFFVHTGASSYFASVTGSNILLTNNAITTYASSNYGPIYYCSNCEAYNNLLINSAGSFPNDLNTTNIIVGSSGMEYYYPSNAGYRYDYNLNLTAESLGNNAANDGTDMGIYGGIFNFSPIGADSGTPQILDFTLGSSTAPQGGTITIHLNANGSGQ